MERTVLILGSRGRFGRNAKQAFQAAGWEVRCFDRATDNLWDAAWGASVIVNAWNPQYYEWADQLPKLHAQVRELASASGATVIIPGNVYNFGTDMPDVLNESTPHLAQNPLGKLRVQMEQEYRRAGVRTIILRAGDFIDTGATGNWFDMVITKSVAKGSISYPGPLDVPHTWAYLPDIARAAVMLAERRHTLDVFEDVPFAGLTLTGAELGTAIGDAMNHPIKTNRMSWLPIQIARPFWKLAKPLLEMRYLWATPHRMDGTRLSQLLPDYRETPLPEVMRSALQHHIHPDQTMPSSGKTVIA